ncbi:MAG: trypsin-like peptidase domain-containing protein [Thermoguttaceae bacterium]|nr:trypsin-like peptidase domain-containing protein [Thermoguttaceae bacterium]
MKYLSLVFVKCVCVVIVAMDFFSTGLYAQLAPSPQKIEAILPEMESRDAIQKRLAASLSANPLEGISTSLRDLTYWVRPSVVQLEVRIPAPKDSKMPTIVEKGSGVLVRLQNQTVVLTNNHVLQQSPSEHPERILIRVFGGESLTPASILRDTETDVAVLTLNGSTERLVTAELTSRPAQLGDLVCSFGHPFGLEQSLALGIVGGLGRCQLKLAGGTIRYQYFIQTDAPMNPGSSGGPLVNLRGEVVGLATGIASSSGGNNGIGFAIPCHLVKKIADQLLTTGRAERGWLGVQLVPALTSQQLVAFGLPRAVGAMVMRVEAGSPAEIAGIRPGDLLLRYDGDLLERAEHLTMLVPFSAPGSTVTIDFLRDKMLYQTRFTVQTHPSSSSTPTNTPP